MINFLNGGGMVGVLDATNSTRNRRQVIHDKCVAHNVEVFYVESVCDDDVRIEETIMVWITLTFLLRGYTLSCFLDERGGGGEGS